MTENEKFAVLQFEHKLHDLIKQARAAGVILTIETVPLQPLAMGHYEMVGDARINRHPPPASPGDTPLHEIQS